MEPGPGGGGEQLHLGIGQDPVITERAAEQAGRHDPYALGVQAAAMDMGAMHTQQRRVRDLIRLALSRLQEQVSEKQLHKELAAHVLAEAELYPGRAKRGLPTR